MKAFLGLLILILLAAGLHAEAPQPAYIYRAEVNQIVAGDTVAMNIDLGFGVWVHNQTLFLQDVTAPDLLGDQKEAALKMKTRLSELLKDRSEIIIQTTRDKSTKPPRFMVVIWADGENINEAMKAVK
jgi:micrococcal nuclease